MKTNETVGMEMRAESQFNSFPLISKLKKPKKTHIQLWHSFFSVRQISYNSGIALYKLRVENLKRIIYT